jgi:hypothetical protein
MKFEESCKGLNPRQEGAMPGYPRGLTVGFVIVVGVGLVSCDGTPVPTTPTPPATAPLTPPSQSGVTLSGVVFDHTSGGARPGANVPLLVHVWESESFMEVTSDATGRYSLSGVPAASISIAATGGSGYYAPCPAGWDRVGARSDGVLDVHVVSATLLSTVGLPADMPLLGAIWVSGVVFERTPQGRQPIAGATVNLFGDGSDPRIGSTTLTDAAGRYRVCPPIPGTGTDTRAPLRVSREGYRPASAFPLLAWDDGVDIELSRN